MQVLATTFPLLLARRGRGPFQSPGHVMVIARRLTGKWSEEGDTEVSLSDFHEYIQSLGPDGKAIVEIYEDAYAGRFDQRLMFAT